MTEVAVILALLFAVFCGALVLIRGVQLGRLMLLDWALLAAGGMYGLGWIVVMLVTQAGANPAWERWILPFASLWWVHTLVAFVLVGGVFAGWYLPARWLPVVPPTGAVDAVHVGAWVRALWLVLLIAVVLQRLYTQAYGGYLGVLEYSNLIRSALFSAVPDNSWSFLKPFGGMAMIAAQGFFGLWLSGRRRFAVLLGFIFSFVFSLYILYSWLGRMGFLVFLATFVLGYGLWRRPRPLVLLGLGALVFVVILGGAYGVSLWLHLKAADSFAAFLARELAFPFGSFFAQLSHGQSLFRGFIDFAVAPIYFLPSSWWTAWYEPVSQVNTTVVMGMPKSEGGTTSGIPVDLLTLGLMQLHVLGALLIGTLFGMLLRLLQCWLGKIRPPGLRALFEAHVALNIAILGVFYSQPDLIISGNFQLMASVVVILAVFLARRMRFLPRHVNTVTES